MMSMLVELLPSIAFLASLLLLSAFFSGSETAIFSLSHAQAKRLAGGGTAADAVHKLLSRPQRLLGTLLVGNMTVNILLSSVNASIMVRIFGGDGWQATGAAIAASLSLLLVFGELTPKTLAFNHPERFALLAGLPLLWFSRLAFPLQYFLGLCARGFLRLGGGHMVPQWGEVTSADVSAMMAAGEEDGVTDGEERELVEHILRLGSIDAHDIMVPRIDIQGVSDELSVREAFQAGLRLRHSRVPVYHGDLDDIWGILSVIDWPRWRDSELVDMPLSSFRETLEGNAVSGEKTPLYAVYVAPETAKLERLLTSMREQRHHMAVLVCEYGGTAGILTLDDILQEVVGHISASDHETEEDYEELPDCVLAGGRTLLRRLREELDMEIEPNGADTVGGYVMERLGRLPRAGDVAEDERYLFRIVKMTGRRVAAVRIEPRKTGREET